MSTGHTTPAPRLARLLRPGRNPLARGVDRLEAMVFVLAMLIAIVLVPVMLTFGSLTHASLADQAAREAATRQESVAVLLEDSPAKVSARGGVLAGSSEVRAQWRLPDGRLQIGPVEADNGLKTGAKVPVWVDESGGLVDPPISSAMAAEEAVLVAVFGWLVAVGLLALACWGVHAVLQRHRYRAWAAEWSRIAPDWHDRSR